MRAETSQPASQASRLPPAVPPCCSRGRRGPATTVGKRCLQPWPSALPLTQLTVAAIIEAAFHSLGWSLCSQPLGSRRGCPVAARAQLRAWARALGHFLLAPPPPGVLSSEQVEGRVRGAGRQPFQLHLASALTPATCPERPCPLPCPTLKPV